MLLFFAENWKELEIFVTRSYMVNYNYKGLWSFMKYIYIYIVIVFPVSLFLSPSFSLAFIWFPVEKLSKDWWWLGEPGKNSLLSLFPQQFTFQSEHFVISFWKPNLPYVLTPLQSLHAYKYVYYFEVTLLFFLFLFPFLSGKIILCVLQVLKGHFFGRGSFPHENQCTQAFQICKSCIFTVLLQNILK